MRVRTEARRESILATAGAAFMELGYEGASMAEIASRADCSKQTLYGYFTSKEELFLGVIGHGVDRAVDPLLEELLAAAGEDPRQVLKRFGERFLVVTLAPEAIAMKRLIIAQMGDPALSKRFWEMGPQRYLATIQSYLAEATRAGRLAVSDPSVAAHQLSALYYAETYNAGLFAGGHGFTHEAIKKLVGRAVDAFVGLYGAS